VLDEVVDERVDPVGSGIAKRGDCVSGKIRGGDYAGPEGVVDVVVDVRDAVQQPDDLAFERRRLRGAAGVVEDSIPDRVAEVETRSVALEPVDDPQRVLVMAKRASEALGQTAIEDVLAEVAEGRMPEIVAEADRLDEVLVETERAGDGPRDSRDLEGMREPGAVVIALGSDEYLRLVLQTPKRLAVNDPVAVALERGPQTAVGLGMGPTRRIGRRRKRGEHRGLERADPIGEGGRDRPARMLAGDADAEVRGTHTIDSASVGRCRADPTLVL